MNSRGSEYKIWYDDRLSKELNIFSCFNFVMIYINLLFCTKSAMDLDYIGSLNIQHDQTFQHTLIETHLHKLKSPSYDLSNPIIHNCLMLFSNL